MRESDMTPFEREQLRLLRRIEGNQPPLIQLSVFDGPTDRAGTVMRIIAVALIGFVLFSLFG